MKFFERYSDSDVAIKRLLCLDLPEKQRNIFHHSSEEIKELLNPGFYKTQKINPNNCVLCKKEFKAEMGYLANLSQGNTFAKLVLKEEEKSRTLFSFCSHKCHLKCFEEYKSKYKFALHC